MIVIYTGSLWSVETSPELSDKNNVASEVKIEFILFYALAASRNLFQLFVLVIFVRSICSPLFVYHSVY